MNCLKCKKEMKKFEPEQTYLTQKPDYICHECGVIVQYIQNQDASGNDTIVITYVERKDATG